MQIEEAKNSRPKIVAFCCNWCSYAGADLAGTNRLNYPADIKVIRVRCSCRVNPMFILRAFQRCRRRYYVLICHPGDCHYTTMLSQRRRMTLLFSMLDSSRHRKGRTRVEWVSAAEGQKFAETNGQLCWNNNCPRWKQKIGGFEITKTKWFLVQKELSRQHRKQSSRLKTGWVWIWYYSKQCSPRGTENDFVYNSFAAANLSKYLVKGKQKGRQNSRISQALRFIQLSGAYERAQSYKRKCLHHRHYLLIRQNIEKIKKRE